MGDFQSDEIILSRKRHKCCECSGVIEKGRQYKRYFGVWDGDFGSYKMCIPCANTFAWLDASLRDGPFGILQDEGICFTQLQDELANWCHDSKNQDEEACARLQSMKDRREFAKDYK
jgi:hypothetical protein